MRPAQICARNTRSVRFLLYNTFCEVTVLDAADADAALDTAVTEAEAVQQLLDAYDPASELSRLNTEAASGRPVEVSAELFALIQTLLRACEASNGAFDITLGALLRLWDFSASQPRKPHPERIAEAPHGHQCVALDKSSQTVRFLSDRLSLDCGAAGKGYAAGRIAEGMRAKGTRRATINLGGNLYLLGDGPHAGQWRTGVQEPWARHGDTVGTLLLPRDTSISTSGGYERYFVQDDQLCHHLLDPATGEPSTTDRLSCTVIARDALAADVLSTTLFVGGPDCFRRVASAVWPLALASFVLVKKDEIDLSEHPAPQFERNAQ